MRWAGHVACMGHERNRYRTFCEKMEMIKLVTRRRRWENNIKTEDGKQNGGGWTDTYLSI